MDRTSEYRQRLVGSERSEAFRDTIQRVRFVQQFQRAHVPKFVKNFLDDCGRKEPRNKWALAQFPEVACALAREGVPLNVVLAPLASLESYITAEAATWMPSLDECLHTETNANCQHDHSQLNIRDVSRLRLCDLDAAIDTGIAQLAAGKQELARLVALRNDLVSQR